MKRYLISLINMNISFNSITIFTFMAFLRSHIYLMYTIMNKWLLTVAIILMAFSVPVHAQKIWTKIDGTAVPTKGERKIVPQKYKIVQLDQNQFTTLFSKIAAGPENASLIQLPNPDGVFVDFKVWKTTMMEKGLQDKYPGIQTFTAQSVNNPNVTAKMDITNYGFHALVFDGENTWFIDPYSNIPDGNYIAYFKKDYTIPLNQRMSCEVGDQDELRPFKSEQLNLSKTLPRMALKQSGSNQKTYRLALSCTGEYAVAVAGASPTVANVLSAMVTTMNRVNGVYEKEIGVTMVLIANNDTLIYTDPDTDPFSSNANNNGGILLGSNQSNINNKIGYLNYDIGHIFSTGGGGIASLASVCAKNQKAQGVTGLSNPVGDAFDIDYVAHEMGHQFGADHTFNANSGSCNDNGYYLTAYEPGSASTIMSYAGICGAANNLQNFSNDYFHGISLDEISDFLVADYGGNWGGGATCGTIVEGPDAPIVPDINETYFIPYKTPFELTAGEGTVTEIGTMTYTWEQWDLGNFGENESGGASFTEGPTFRSYLPSTNHTRVFPIIDSIINGNTSFIGERLPQVARSLSFKLTVRNILNGWGAFDMSDNKLTVDVIDTGMPFEITEPNSGGLVWEGTTTKTVNWNVAQTDVAPINCTNVDIFLSIDGGYTYPITLASNVPNNGTATITVPDVNVLKARIKVKGAGNIFFDISNQDIEIYKAGDVGVKDINQGTGNLSIYPNPVSNLLNIKNENNQSLRLNLVNSVGQTIWQGEMNKEAVIDVKHYARGIYFLNVENEQTGIRTVKKISLK